MDQSIAEKFYADVCGSAGLIDLEGWASDNDVKVTMHDHQEVDRLMFLCDTCGWWCDIGELGSGEDGLVCSQCEDD